MAHSDDSVLVHLVHRPCVACGSPSGRHAQRPAGWALVTCHTLSVTRTLALICVTGALYFLAKPWGRGSRLVSVRSRGLLLVDLFACSLLYVYLLIFLLLCPCYLYWLLFMSLLGCVLYSLVALWHAWTEILLLARDPNTALFLHSATHEVHVHGWRLRLCFRAHGSCGVTVRCLGDCGGCMLYTACDYWRQVFRCTISLYTCPSC